jgi:hypothetical protein
MLEEKKSEESLTNGARLSTSKLQSQLAAGQSKLGVKVANRNKSPLNEFHSD